MSHHARPQPGHYAAFAPAQARRSPRLYDGLPEIAALGLLLLGLLFVGSGEADATSPVLNVICPVALVLILGYGARRLLADEPMSIWSPLLWFRVATMAYFGVGALAPYIANDATVVLIKQFYFFSEGDAYKFNLITLLATIAVLVGAMCVNQGATRSVQRARMASSSASLPMIALGFLVTGGLARYGFVVPSMLGFHDEILPSIVAMASKAYSAGLMLLLVMALNRYRVLLPLACVLIGIELAIGVLVFNKTDVLITIIFVVLAVYMRLPSLAVLATGAFIALFTFVQLAPMIGYGRVRTAELSGGEQVATFEQRLKILNEYRDGQRLEGEAQDVQHGYYRLCYTNAATMVIALYDSGTPLNTLEKFLAAFVPRFIWPEKPDLTDNGRNLYMLATGHEGTSISATLPAEAYANLGWLGVLLLMTAYGIILGLLHKAALSVMKNERWLFLPVVLMGVQIGTRIDGHYVIDVIGAPFTVAIMYVILYLFGSLAPSVQRHVRH